jgi:hypothetical protein
MALPFLLELGLSVNALERFDKNVVARMTRHRDAAFLHRVFVLPMASFLRNQRPSIGLDSLDDVANFQVFAPAFFAPPAPAFTSPAKEQRGAFFERLDAHLDLGDFEFERCLKASRLGSDEFAHVVDALSETGVAIVDPFAEVVETLVLEQARDPEAQQNRHRHQNISVKPLASAMGM